jgi:hypothetical protein
VNWTGGPTGLGTDWADRTNWAGNVVPTTADDAVIGSAFSAVTIVASVNAGARTLRSSAPVRVDGGTFSLGAGTSVIDGGLTVEGGALSLTGTTLDGLGALTNRGSAQVTGTINTALINEGALVVQDGDCAVNGPLSNSAAGALQVFGGGRLGVTATLTVADGFTNLGLIELSTRFALIGETATLTVTAGTLTNAAGATLNASAGNGGSRVLNAQLDNQGTVLISRPTTLSAASAAHQNTGTITVGTGGLTITQSGVSPSFTNAGTIDLIDGGLTVSQSPSAVFTNAGSITMGPLSTLTVSGGQFVPDTGALSGPVQLNGVALGSGSLSSDAVVTLSSGSELPGAVLNNEGSLVLLNANLFNGTFLNDDTGTLQVRGTSSFGTPFPASLTLTSGMTNTGLIELVAFGDGVASALTVTSGTLTNGLAGTINVLAGFLGPRLLNAQLDNQGTINVNNGAGLTLPPPTARRG